MSGLPGVVRIEYPQTGRQTWYLRYRDPVTRKRTIERLGDVGVLPFMDMVAKAKVLHDCIAAGLSPRSATLSVSRFVEGPFAAWVLNNKASGADDMSWFRNYWREAIGDMPLAGVTAADLQRNLDQLYRDGRRVKRGGRLSDNSVNHIAMTVRLIFRVAVELGYRRDNPAAKLRTKPVKFAAPVCLDDEELVRLGHAIAAAPERIGLLLQLLLSSALRISEALKLCGPDIDRKRGVIVLRSTKAGEAQEVPLTPDLLAIVDRLIVLQVEGNRHLFPASSGAGPMPRPYAALRKVYAVAGITPSGFHVLRKSAASQAMRLPGVDVLLVSKWLRHKSVRTTEVHYLGTSQKRLHQAASDVGALMQAKLRHGRASVIDADAPAGKSPPPQPD